jgi:hypothetical protein
MKRSWESVERALGVGLPSDYKNFIDHYGSGCICPADAQFGSIIIYNLRAVPDVVSWVSALSRRYERDREVGYESPYTYYPQVDGLLGWATTPSGDFFNWQMKGTTDKWGVVFYHCSTAKFIALGKQNFARVLVDLLRGKSSLIPRQFNASGFAPPCRFTEENW